MIHKKTDTEYSIGFSHPIKTDTGSTVLDKIIELLGITRINSVKLGRLQECVRNWHSSGIVDILEKMIDPKRYETGELVPVSVGYIKEYMHTVFTKLGYKFEIVLALWFIESHADVTAMLKNKKGASIKIGKYSYKHADYKKLVTLPVKSLYSEEGLLGLMYATQAALQER